MTESEERNFDEHVKELFAPIRPRDDFEDSLLAKLREKPSRRIAFANWKIHPAAVAASLLVGTIGYFANEQLESPNRAKVASNLRQLGQAQLLYSNQSKWDFGGEANPSQNWSTWNTSKSGVTSGFRLNDSLRADSDVAADAKPQAQQSASANDRTEDKENVVYGDGHVTYEKNPFTGVQRDNIFTTQNGSTAFGNGAILKSPFDSSGSVIVPREDAAKETGKRPMQGNLKMPASELIARGGRDNGPSTQPNSPAIDDALAGRSIIRTGTIELEVDNFDATFNQIKKLVADDGGYIGTINSEKLPNGKVRGTMTLRVPPEKTDDLVNQIRPLGEIKRQNLAAEEVTKQLADLQRQFDTATTMHQHLTELSSSKTGQVKDKVNAEREAGEWRQKAEQTQSQIASLKNQVTLATITVVLNEKGLDASATVRESETMEMGVETEDVEKARADATKAMEEAKGRIVQSELKQFDAGQLTAHIVAEVSSDRAGAVSDRLKQLGRVTRLDVQRQSSGTSGLKPAAETRVERDDTRLVISFYNLANLSPRISSSAFLACEDVEQSYRAILDRVMKANGRILASQINRQQSDGGVASIQFELKSTDADAVLTDIRAIGELMKLESNQNNDTNNVTAAKRGFVVQIVSIATASSRQVTTKSIASTDVSSAYNALLETARKNKARLIVSKLDQQAGQPTSGALDFEIRRSDIPAIETALAGAGDVVSANVAISSDTQNTLESKVQYRLTLSPADHLSPRESTNLGIETNHVEAALAQLTKAAVDAGGKAIDARVSRESSGRMIARTILDIPLDKNAELIDLAESLGAVRISESARNTQAPEGKLARARIDLTLATPDAIVQADAGVFTTVRAALATSAMGLMWSLKLIVIGVCLVAPWALIGWGGWKTYRRMRDRSQTD